LPGPYTLILKTKKQCVAENVAPDLDTLGIRIPDHWFSNFVNEIDIPIVTTSVNKSSEDFMTSLDDLDSEIKSRVDFIVNEGEKKGNTSKIIDLTDDTEVIER
jgi:tRNA threonylcarbamoyl adenosine modification protein (Sua5/YciO/YrdC/YwlC family)